MRLTARIVAVIAAVAVIGGGGAACGGSGARPASEQITAHTPSAKARSRPSKPPAGPAMEVTGAPRGVKAKGAVLADATTGQVLWGRAPDTERPMASVTKVMT